MVKKFGIRNTYIEDENRPLYYIHRLKKGLCTGARDLKQYKIQVCQMTRTAIALKTVKMESPI